jgi:phage anti-repressor protein
LFYHQQVSNMNLPILTSKKGTRVVKASELHRALGLADHHYQTNVRTWIKDVYQFPDAIRRAEGMKDYARARQSANVLVLEYYLSVEFAKLIALASKSKVKQAVATKLSKEAEVFPEHVKLDGTAFLQLLEQTKAMTRISCQQAAESRHRKHYVQRRGNAEYWNHFRHEQVVLTTMEELRHALSLRKIKVSAKHHLRDLLLRKDPYELIRIGITDHYAAQGNPLPYAQELGRLARKLAQEMHLEVVDDRKGDLLFAPAADAEVLRQLQRAAA